MTREHHFTVEVLFELEGHQHVVQINTDHDGKPMTTAERARERAGEASPPSSTAKNIRVVISRRTYSRVGNELRLLSITPIRDLPDDAKVIDLAGARRARQELAAAAARRGDEPA